MVFHVTTQPVAEGERALPARVGKYHHELVSAIPRDGVSVANDQLHDGRDLLQHEITDRMPARIIDLLEVVEIDRRDRDRRAAPTRGAEIGTKTRLQRPAIEAPRQRIASHLLGETR